MLPELQVLAGQHSDFSFILTIESLLQTICPHQRCSQLSSASLHPYQHPVAVCLTLVACEPDEERFWNWPGVQTALAVYILVVAIVYAAILQGLWIPKGLEFLTDRIFHAVLPMLYIAYWVFFTPKGSLRLADQIIWQSYPLIYMSIL